MEKEYSWDEEELYGAFVCSKKIPGIVTWAAAVGKIVCLAAAAIGAVWLFRLIRVMPEAFGQSDSGVKLRYVLAICLWIFCILYFIYYAFFRQGHRTRKMIRRDREHNLLPCTLRLDGNVFSESDADGTEETVLGDAFTVYFIGRYVYGVEKESEKETLIRWYFPRRVFQDPGEEEEFRRLCERYCRTEEIPRKG